VASLALAGLVAWIALTPDRGALWRAGVDRAETLLGGDFDQEPLPAAAEDSKASSPSAADAAQEDANERPGAGVEIVGGRPTVRLDAATQARSGIATTVLEPVNYTPEIGGTGRVLDLQSLLAQRSRYTDARYGGDVVRATLAAAKKEYDRLAKLHSDEGDIATKRLQESEAAVKRAEAELRRSEAEMASIREETRQQWGPTLADWALEHETPEFDRLLERKDVLLLVTLPAGETLSKGATLALIGRGGDRTNMQEAQYVSPAPATDPVTQGETHFFRTDARSLRSEMRVDVWIARPGAPQTGVVVPSSAVVWATGQAWAYVQSDADHFVRWPVPTAVAVPGGWFVHDGLKPGDRLVTTGAQMLFAEEFRWQIRDEDKD
jgi:hypothetical protein